MNTIEFGDCRDTMRSWAAQGVHAQMCVTSPPYFGLRDYGHEGQLGLEQTPEQYIAAMVEVFRCVRDVLADDGTLWLNVADCYSSDGADRYSIALTDAQAAWLAALIDGEGCIQVHEQGRAGNAPSFQVDVSVGQMDEGMVRHAHIITGLGSCQIQNRGVWDWSVRGQQAAELLRHIYPHLILKKGQAAGAIMLAEHVANAGFNKGHGVTEEAVQYRRSIKAAVAACNQRAPNGFALQEPKLPPAGNVKPKDLLGIPWLLAFALRADGWFLRQEIIWEKPNPMPESVRDRCTRAHEYMFLLSKSRHYFFDAEAIKEPAVRAGAIPGGKGHYIQHSAGGHNKDGLAACGQRPVAAMRNRRSVWTVASRPYKGAHFATFPPALIEPCILAGSRLGDVVLDPFMGSGTTAAVALQLGRQYLGCELNPDYEPLQRERIEASAAPPTARPRRRAARPPEPEPAQRGLF